MQEDTRVQQYEKSVSRNASYLPPPSLVTLHFWPDYGSKWCERWKKVSQLANERKSNERLIQEKGKFKGRNV